MEKVIKKLDNVILAFIFLYAISAAISIAASETFLGIALVIWLVKLVKSKFKSLKSSSIDVPIIAFIIFRVISTFAGVDVANSMLKLKELTLFIVIYLVRYNLNQEMFKKSMIALIYSAAVGVVSRIIYMYLIQGLPFDKSNRLSGFSSGYMTYGSILTIIILLGAAILLFSKLEKIHKILLMGSLLILGAGLGLTLTRSAWVGLFTGMLFLGIFKNRFLLFAMIGLLIIGFLFAPPKIKSRVFSIFSKEDATINTRLQMWDWGLKVFKDHPILGIGPNNVKKMKSACKQYPLEKLVEEQMVHQHSNFMQFLVTLGLLGFLVFIWMILSFSKVLIQSIKKFKADPFYSGATWGIAAGFLGFIVTGLFEYNFFDSEVILIIFFLIGGTIAILNKSEDEKINQN
ncbi:O-antigen ligase family protein [Candidatus Dependentiae bacterium]|nr:O-antigen ligase family protein [Candidatus Dependentiae bacterium]